MSVTGSPVQGSRGDRRGRSRGPSRRRLLIGFGIAVVVFDILLILIDRRLAAVGGPSILGLEFAGSATRAHQIMAEWGDHGRSLARLSLWIDFGFMLSYGTFFALAGFATRDFARANGRRALARAGVAAPYCAIAAAVFDAAEDIIWLLVLGGHGGEVGPPIATTCASLKFLLIGIAIVYALWGLCSRFLRRRDRKRPRVSIRPMLPHELEAAVSVWRAANIARGAPHGAERTARIRAKLAAPDALAFVALGSEIVGMALAEPGRFDDGEGELDPTLLHISMVFVHPAAQGTGIGSSLVLHVLDAARSLGYQQVGVWTYSDNTAARRLYEGVGMTTTGKSAPVLTRTRIQYGFVLGAPGRVPQAAEGSG